MGSYFSRSSYRPLANRVLQHILDFGTCWSKPSFCGIDVHVGHESLEAGDDCAEV